MSIGIAIDSTNRGQYVYPASIRYSRPQLGSRGTADFTLRVPDGYKPEIGQDVALYDGASRVFGGSIEQLTEIRLGLSDTYEYQVSCTSNERKLDKRVIRARVYKDQTAKQIIEDLLGTDLAYESISIGTVDDGATVSKVIFDGITGASAFDQLASLSGYIWYLDPDSKLYFIPRNTTTAPFTLTGAKVMQAAGMKITYTRADFRDSQVMRLSFAAFADSIESFAGDNTTKTFALAKPVKNLISIVLTTNAQPYVQGTFSGVPSDGDTVTLNGVHYTFKTVLDNSVPWQVAIGANAHSCAVNLAHCVNDDGNGRGSLYSSATTQHPNCDMTTPVGVIVTARFKVLGDVGNGAPVSASTSAFSWAASSMTGGAVGTTTTVNFGNRDSEVGKDWYYAPGEVEITQDSAADAMAAGTFLQVQYQALGGDMFSVEDWSVITDRATVEGNSGRYEVLTERTDIVDGNVGLQTAQGLLSTYKSIPEIIEFETRDAGLQPGQILTVNVAKPAVSGTYLIDAVDGHFIPTEGHFRTSVRMISTNRIGTWLQWWNQLSAQASSGTISASGVVGSSGTTPIYGTAPDVANFAAGILNPDGTYTPQLRWDETLSEFLLDLYCEQPAGESFGGVQFYLQVPNPLVVSGFEYDPIGTPFLRLAFKSSGTVNALSAAISIAWETTPTAGETWNVIACSINPTGAENTNSGIPAGPNVSLTVLSSATPIYSAPTQPASFTATVVEVGYNEDAQMPMAHLRVVIPAWETTANIVRVYQAAGSVPADPSGWGPDVCAGAIAQTGSTQLDWWTPQSFTAALTVHLRVRASSPTYNTNAADAGVADQSLSIPQVGAPDQVTDFACTLHTQSQGGVSSGALEITWTTPSDVKYFTSNVYSIQCNSSYVPLPGAQWNLIGSALNGFDQRKLVPPQWWPLGTEQWVQIKAQSVGRAKDPATGTYIENTVSPPTVNLHVVATTGLDASSFNASTIDSNTLAIINGKLTGLIAAQESLFTSLNSTDFQVVSGQLAIKNIDLGKALGTSYNTAELRLNNGKLEVNGVDLTKVIATSITAELAVSGGKFGVASLSAAKITAGYLAAGVIYTGSITASQIVSGTLGAGVIYGGTIYGSQIYAQTLTSFTINSSTLNSVTINTGTLTSGQIYGTTISLNLNGIVTSINNTYTGGYVVGLTCSGASYTTAIGSQGYWVYSGSYFAGTVKCFFGVDPGGTGLLNLQNAAGSSVIQLGAGLFNPFTINGYTIINYAGAFVGAGVNCTGNGIGGTGHNTYYGGGWRYGKTESHYDRDGNLMTFYGGVLAS